MISSVEAGRTEQLIYVQCLYEKFTVACLINYNSRRKQAVEVGLSYRLPHEMGQLVRYSLKAANHPQIYAGRLFKLINSDVYQFLPQRKQVLIPHNFFMVLK